MKRAMAAFALPAVACLATAVGTAAAQVIRVPAATLRPNSLLGNTSITLSASPSGVTFSLVSGSGSVASGPIAITVTLTNPATTTVNVFGFFASPTAALTGSASASTIPTSCVFGLVSTGVPTSYTAFTQTNVFGGAGAGLELLSLGGLTANHSETNNLSLKIDLSTLPRLPADTYTGTVFLQAQAF